MIHRLELTSALLYLQVATNLSPRPDHTTYIIMEIRKQTHGQVYCKNFF